MKAYRDPDTRNGERILVVDGVEKDESGVEYSVMSVIKEGKLLSFRTKIKSDRLKKYPKLSRSDLKKLQDPEKKCEWKFCPNCGTELK